VLAPAVTSAYKYAADRPLNVIILSDGLTQQNERAQLIQLIRQRPQRTRVFCIGVGNDVDRRLLEQLATDSGGLAAFVSREDSFERQAAAFRRKLMHPVASNVKIEFEGLDVYDIEPQQLGNLYHGMPVRLYARYKGSGAVTVKVSGDVDGQPLATSVAIDLPAQDSSNPEIERMWAWHRVDRLLKEADSNNARSGVLDQIIALGEGYSIVTEYTSFIVLENDAEYERWKIERRNALRIERDRGAQQKLAAQLDAMRQEATAALGPAPAIEPANQIAANTPKGAAPQTVSPSAGPGAMSRDLPLGRGGGAVDPHEAIIAVILAGVALLCLKTGTRASK
jgi:Ca-activated chloride channel family protein